MAIKEVRNRERRWKDGRMEGTEKEKGGKKNLCAQKRFQKSVAEAYFMPNGFTTHDSLCYVAAK